MELRTKIIRVEGGATYKGSELLTLQEFFKNYSFIAEDKGDNLEIQVEYLHPAEESAVNTSIELADKLFELSGKTASKYERRGPIYDISAEDADCACGG